MGRGSGRDWQTDRRRRSTEPRLFSGRGPRTPRPRCAVRWCYRSRGGDGLRQSPSSPHHTRLSASGHLSLALRPHHCCIHVATTPFSATVFPFVPRHQPPQLNKSWLSMLRSACRCGSTLFCQRRVFVATYSFSLSRASHLPRPKLGRQCLLLRKPRCDSSDAARHPRNPLNLTGLRLLTNKHRWRVYVARRTLMVQLLMEVRPWFLNVWFPLRSPPSGFARRRRRSRLPQVLLASFPRVRD